MQFLMRPRGSLGHSCLPYQPTACSQSHWETQGFGNPLVTSMRPVTLLPALAPVCAVPSAFMEQITPSSCPCPGQTGCLLRVLAG